MKLIGITTHQGEDIFINPKHIVAIERRGEGAYIFLTTQSYNIKYPRFDEFIKMLEGI